MSTLRERFIFFAKDIKISHSVFALPFALCGILLCESYTFSLNTGFFILLCMIFARSFAMGANRFIDRFIDEKNPRTAARALPARKLSSLASLGFTLFSGGLFIASSFAIRTSIGYLSLPVLFILAIYSYMKRWTWLCHFYLGFCLSLSPIAAALAFSGSVPACVFFLSFGVLCWTSGFDIIYAIQDQDHDKKVGLKSIPETFGINKALWISRGCFFAAIFFFWLAGELQNNGWIYRTGIMIIAGLLFLEHWLVKDLGENEPKKGSYTIEDVFFKVNALVSVVFYLALQGDRLFFN